jgi:hypothetical protein
MRTVTLISVLALCAGLAGCGRIYGPVEQVKAYIDAKEEVILQIGKKVEADPSEAGVAEARKVFEAKRADLKAKRDAINAAPRGMNADWLTMLMTSRGNDMKYFDAISGQLAVKCTGGACLPAQEKFRALEKDFLAATE